MRFLKYLFLATFSLYAILFFLPKENLYYGLENLLAKESIFISGETIKPKPFGIKLNDLEIIYENVHVGDIKNINFDFLIFKNSLHVKSASLKSNSFKFIPRKIDDLMISYSILHPKEITLKIDADIGVVFGYFDLLKQTLHVELQVNKKSKSKYNNILSKFKQNKKGVYIYEKTFKIY
jgi:hypothetical protein